MAARKRSSIRGGNKLRRALRRLPKELREGMGEYLKKEGRELRDAIAADAPREKGDMAKAVHYKVSGDKLSVHIGYSPKRAGFKRKWKKGGFVAIWQEFGTKHHAADPFIRPQFRARVSRIKSGMRQHLKRMLKQARSYGT